MNGTKHVENIPTIKGVKDLEIYVKPKYVMETYMANADIYKNLFETMWDVIRGCFEIKECREYPVEVAFYSDDKEAYTLEFRHFVINLILWGPLVSIGEMRFMNKDFIMDGHKIIEDPEYDLEGFINDRIIHTLRVYNVRSVVVDKSLSEMLYNLRRVSIDFADIMNLNFSFFTIYDTFKKNPRIREIMESKFPDMSDPRANELSIDAMQTELISMLKADRTNPIGTILRSGTGIKHKQLTEFMIAQGYKPTIDGKVITIPIENSTLIGGLNRPSYLAIDAGAARKSLIMNKTVMGRAGNFGKLVLQLARTLSLSETVTDCDTKHAVPIKIKSKKHLKKLQGRFYRRSTNDEFSVLDPKKNGDLIGETLEFRSPATCALGNCVCQKCYGINAAINYELAGGLPAFESEEVTKEVNQNVLSAKHLLTTKSEVIVFSDEFYKYFTLNAGEVYPDIDNNETLSDPSKFAIWIDPASVERLSELDVDSSYNTYISTGVFYVENLETGERDEIKLTNEKEMFFSDLLSSLWRNKRKKDGYIYFTDLDSSTPILEMSILNDELTKPLYNMMKLFNNSKHAPTTIADAVQMFIDILIESGIKASSVAGECIINRLIRSVDNIYERPDFTKDELEPYEIKTVAYCLKCNASPTLGLATQFIRAQILDPKITERTGTSFMDPLMKIKVPNLYSIYAENRNMYSMD